MESDKRDVIWERTYYTYYETYFFELICDGVISRWQLTSDFSKLLVAITTSGSAISSWALWKNSIGVYVWVLIVGIASVLSIVNATWSATNKIKEWTEIKNYCINLRIEIEIFKDNMLIDPDFNVEEFQRTLMKYKKNFGELKKKLKPDVFIRKRLRDQAQNKLNIYIQSYAR
ncbi:MAG TPA: hypothetical protein VIH57_10605 [Bacteroidales bacterium]